MEEIKSCPFCGGIAYLESNYSHKSKSYFVYCKCELCRAQGKTIKDDNDPSSSNWEDDACETAVHFWNMRV